MVQMAKPMSTSVGSLVRYVACFVGALCLVGLVSTAIHILFPVLQVLVPGFVGWWVWQRHHRAEKRQHKKLHTTFYRLLREHHGRMTLLDFAMTAEIPAIAARHYLDNRAKEFAARFEVTEQGDVIYVFSTLQFAPLQSPLASMAVTTDVSPDEPLLPDSLTQAELAKRLGVAAKTISRKKHLPTLSAWTQTRDPNGVGWSYSTQVQRFFPLNERISIQAEAERH